MFTFGSLFSGIGGMDLGLERAGMVCKWQVEIDDYASRVLAKHWPDVQRFRDVRDVGRHNLESVDLIAGGFPCQDISNAGKRAGIDGERSGLWSEFARIIRELRPRYVLVENVAALLVRGIERVLGDLATSGYNAEWDCVPAAAVGAPHLRERIFIVAYSDKPRLERRIFGTQPTAKTSMAVAGCCEAIPNPNRSRRSWEGVSGSIANRNQWAVEPNVGRVANGIPARVDRLRTLGNAVVPQVAQWIGERIMEANQERTKLNA